MELILEGRYLPISILGKGGFGTAFLARDFSSPTRRQCVVKLFQPPVNLTPTQLNTALRLFGKEAEVLERLGLQHPQIPNLYAYFPLPVTNPLTNQSEELFYLVQEFLDGEDLEKILERDGALSEAEVTTVLKAILDVLGFVHRNGVIHRDVKPSNIMKGYDGRLSLLDFGAVKEVTAPSGGQNGPTKISSPDFAPPEQIMNGSVNPTSDLYALAATCVVLLTNQSSNQLRDSSTNTWNWKAFAKQVSQELAQVLDKMLRPRPGDRYPSAEAVLADLALVTQSGLKQTSPVMAPPISPSAAQPAPKRAQTSVPQPAPAPAPPIAKAKPVAPAKVSAPVQPISLIRFLGHAAFSGAEGGLLAIATFSLIGTSVLGGGVWLAMLAGLIFLQVRRTIEGVDLLIIAGITLGAVIFFYPLHGVLAPLGGGTALILVTTVMAAGAVVAIAVIFRLIFRLLSRIM